MTVPKFFTFDLVRNSAGHEVWLFSFSDRPPVEVESDDDMLAIVAEIAASGYRRVPRGCCHGFD